MSPHVHSFPRHRRDDRFGSRCGCRGICRAAVAADDRRRRVDAGVIFNALAAVGALSAAAAAVWIATRDRRERKQERDAADEAQAALVIAQPFRSGRAGLGVAVQNYGTLSILQVTTVKLDVEGNPHLDLRRMPGGATTVPVVAPRRDYSGPYYTPSTPYVEPRPVDTLTYFMFSFRAPAVQLPETDERGELTEHSINSTFHVSLRRLHR